MYRVTLTVRDVSDKDALRLLAPTLVWLASFLVTLCIMCITEFWFLVLPLFAEFMCIIPVTVWSIKKARKLRQKPFAKMDVMLTARDGMLYRGDMKLNASYDKQDNEVYIDDGRVLRGRYPHRIFRFFATISGDDVEGFIRFCQENKVQVDIFPEY